MGKSSAGSGRSRAAEILDQAATVRVDTTDQYTIPVASRLLRLPPYLFGRLNAMKYQLRRAGADIIDLGMGNPNEPPPQVVVDKLCEAARDPRNHRYSVSTGVYNLRREAARHYAKVWGVELDPESEIIATIGSKEGFSHMCLALLGPGDTALVPSPAFPVHVYAVALAGANVITIPQDENQEAFLRQIVWALEHIYPRPKVLILNFPNNPTTVCVELGFFEEVVQIAKRYGILVISDLAYGETVFDGYHAPCFLQARGAKEVGCEFITMSKQYSMAGWRMGFCAGHPEMVRALAKIKGYYDYGIFQALQIAAIIAFRHCDAAAREQAMVYQRRRDCLCDGLNRSGWNVKPPKATMFVWAPMPEAYREMGSVEFALKLMRDAEVAVAPGRGFGEAGEGYLRIALVENENRIRQAVRQIRRALR
ncbi:MAG TPA: aminotransferase class I/II-fold pyridoxal phosphate-dependent enzyme [Planctomycetota bacterium]|nr:aminotransferase class I/II-fold pyridoxal phosphate-dependent enzyme [Planctomycetota bacterium]